jgi:nucleoid-associated protein YgaU
VTTNATPEGRLQIRHLAMQLLDSPGDVEVKQGDTLSKIAKQYYVDKLLYPKIFSARRDVLSDPNMIKPGQKLLIP